MQARARRRTGRSRVRRLTRRHETRVGATSNGVVDDGVVEGGGDGSCAVGGGSLMDHRAGPSCAFPDTRFGWIIPAEASTAPSAMGEFASLGARPRVFEAGVGAVQIEGGDTSSLDQRAVSAPVDCECEDFLASCHLCSDTSDETGVDTPPLVRRADSAIVDCECESFLASCHVCSDSSEETSGELMGFPITHQLDHPSRGQTQRLTCSAWKAKYGDIQNGRDCQLATMWP